MAKKKSKLKKILGAVAAAGTAALAAGALGRRKQNKIYNQEEGGDLSRGSLPMSKRQVEGLNFPVGTDLSGMNKIADRGSIDEKDYDVYGNKKSYKSGGRVGVGIAKRGFGRAMKGKK